MKYVLKTFKDWDNNYIVARRRAAAKKKLKNLGKSKSTDTEEEEQDEDCGDDGQYNTIKFSHTCIYFLCVVSYIKLNSI